MIDDVVTIELRAIAGVTIPLVDQSFTPDAAAAQVSDNLKTSSSRYHSGFPYIGTPLRRLLPSELAPRKSVSSPAGRDGFAPPRRPAR